MSVEYALEGHVARVTIARPERMNAVDVATAEALEAAWRQIESDDRVRVVVLTGSGERAFCAGADLKSTAGQRSGLDYWAHARPNGFGGLALRHSLNVPVIARVNGFALGGGFEMVLGCDIVIAAEHASFGFPEPRVGNMPVDGGMVLLPRMIADKRAMGMLLTGRRISAAEAERFGLVNAVVPASALDATVNEWLDDILACAPLCVQAIKESVRHTAALPADVAHARRSPALLAAIESEDAGEGPRAFREKREPRWQGR